MRAVNLMPGEQRGAATLGVGRSQGTAYAVLGLLAGLAVLVFIYGKARHEVSSRTAQAASITARVSQVQSEAAKLAPYTSFVTLREQRAAAVAELVNSRFDWAHGFHELGRVLPSGVWLTSISGSVGGTTPGSSSAATPGAITSSTPAGSVPTFALSGCASSQSQVALALDRLRLIDGVSAVTLDSSGSASPGGTATATCKTSFTAELTFEALPTSSTVASATAAAAKPVRTVANTTGGAR